MARTEPQTIIAIYDGQVLRPEGPLDLEVDARYRVTIEPAGEEAEGDTLWDYLERIAGTVEMPPDWSTEHDHYLYGTPKRGGETEE